jgi:hypothetical protein
LAAPAVVPPDRVASVAPRPVWVPDACDGSIAASDDPGGKADLLSSLVLAAPDVLPGI